MNDLAATPLGPFRVLEIGSTVAGPFCGRLLAEFGAEVLKIEPLEGDAVRSMGSRTNSASLYAATIFRNKRLLAVDLRKAEGQRLAQDLAAQCDVIVENFRPGTLEKWGLGYDDLRRRNPGVVMVRISGFGQYGPCSHLPGYGVTSEAMSGLRHLTGDPDRPPARVGTSLTDYITGLYAAFGAVMALLVRQTTGRGQVVDASLCDSAFSFTEPHVPAFEKLGVVATRTGSRLPNHTPNNLYPTGDGRFVHITAAADSLFRRLAMAIGQETLLADERFKDPLSRAENEDAIDGIIACWTSQRTQDDTVSTLEKYDVPAAKVMTVEDIFSHVHFRARDMLVPLPSAELGEVTVAGIVPKLSVTPGKLHHAGGRVGADTRAILSELLAMPDTEIAELEASDVIRC